MIQGLHELPHPPPVFCTSMFFTIHKILIIQSYPWPIAYFGLNVKRNPNKKTLKNLLVIEQVNKKMKGQMVLSSLNFLVAPWIQSCLDHTPLIILFTVTSTGCFELFQRTKWMSVYEISFKGKI